MTPENVLALQRSVGNGALARAIADAAPTAKAPAHVVARYRSIWDRIAAVPGAIEQQFSHRRETRRKIRDDDRLPQLEAKAKRAAQRGDLSKAAELRTEARKLRGKREGEDENWYYKFEEYPVPPPPPPPEPKYEPPAWEFGDDD